MNSEENTMNNDSSINIKIRTLDKEFKVKIKKEEKIIQLKEKIETVRFLNLYFLDSKSSNRKTKINF